MDDEVIKDVVKSKREITRRAYTGKEGLHPKAITALRMFDDAITAIESKK